MAVCAMRVAALVLVVAGRGGAGPRYSSRIVHTGAGAIRGVIVEPASRRLEPVEVFRGVPYAGRPDRLAPPPPAPPWPGTRLADAFAPVCPQVPPDLANRSAALARMPLGVYEDAVAALPFLADQSEDCLYLNIYVPGSGSRGVEAPYAVVVWVGGGSYEWGSANAIDGSVLAARHHLLVVTVNHRLGLLGFLTTGAPGDAAAAAGGAALLDVVAALRWVRRDIAAFGGDPARVTLAGHAAGAALANAILMLPEAKGLVSRLLVLSGSALGPAALAPDAALARQHAAQALRCPTDTHSDTGDHWLVACVRARPLAALVGVGAPRARFLAGWAPAAAGGAGGAARALHASEAFLGCALAVVVTTTESYGFFAEDDIRHGFEEEHRNRILRTYVRNVYRYHRNEIFAAIRNEYTDWEKPIQHPINIRDSTLESLSDAAVAAPALRLAMLHARRGGRTHVAHFAHQTRDADYPQRLGSVPSESLTYFLGLPLVGGAGRGRNYSRADVAAAEASVALVAALARGEGAGGAGAAWPRYTAAAQQYVAVGGRARARSHYRGHKLALWLHLIPQLHRPGAAARHHQFRDADADLFAGEVFPELYTTTSALDDDDDDGEGEESEEVEGGVECMEEGGAPLPALPAPRPAGNTRLAPVDDAHYYSYTVWLGVTVGAGCCVLVLNALVLAALYTRRRAHTRAHHSHALRRHGSARAASPASPRSPRSPPSPLPAPEVTSPRKSTLKRSSESELKERAAAPHKKRVHIQEISV